MREFFSKWLTGVWNVAALAEGAQHTQRGVSIIGLYIGPHVEHLSGLPAFALWIDCEYATIGMPKKRAIFLANDGRNSVSPFSMRLILELLAPIMSANSRWL